VRVSLFALCAVAKRYIHTAKVYEDVNRKSHSSNTTVQLSIP